jgi:hypothetical protein
MTHVICDLDLLFRAAMTSRTPPSPPRASALAVRRSAYVAVVVARPHPLPILRRGGRGEDAAYDDTAFEHVVVVVAPLAERAAFSS